MLDINGGELLILVLVAVIVIGPERMPEYTRQLRSWVIRGRDLFRESKASVKAEMGDEVNWSELDPRQYDPRRIVRDALAEPSSPSPAAAAPRASSAATPGKAPFDAEAT